MSIKSKLFKLGIIASGMGILAGTLKVCSGNESRLNLLLNSHFLNDSEGVSKVYGKTREYNGVIAETQEPKIKKSRELKRDNKDRSLESNKELRKHKAYDELVRSVEELLNAHEISYNGWKTELEGLIRKPASLERSEKLRMAVSAYFRETSQVVIFKKILDSLKSESGVQIPVSVESYSREKFFSGVSNEYKYKDESLEELVEYRTTLASGPFGKRTYIWDFYVSNSWLGHALLLEQESLSVLRAGDYIEDWVNSRVRSK